MTGVSSVTLSTNARAENKLSSNPPNIESVSVESFVNGALYRDLESGRSKHVVNDESRTITITANLCPLRNMREFREILILLGAETDDLKHPSSYTWKSYEQTEMTHTVKLIYLAKFMLSKGEVESLRSIEDHIAGSITNEMDAVERIFALNHIEAVDEEFGDLFETREDSAPHEDMDQNLLVIPTEISKLSAMHRAVITRAPEKEAIQVLSDLILDDDVCKRVFPNYFLSAFRRCFHWHGGLLINSICDMIFIICGTVFSLCGTVFSLCGTVLFV